MKLTCSMRGSDPSLAIRAANSSSKALDNGSTKFRWNDSYKLFCISSAIRLILSNDGVTKYTAGTSGNGGRAECSCLQLVSISNISET